MNHQQTIAKVLFLDFLLSTILLTTDAAVLTVAVAVATTALPATAADVAVAVVPTVVAADTAMDCITTALIQQKKDFKQQYNRVVEFCE